MGFTGRRLLIPQPVSSTRFEEPAAFIKRHLVTTAVGNQHYGVVLFYCLNPALETRGIVREDEPGIFQAMLHTETLPDGRFDVRNSTLHAVVASVFNHAELGVEDLRVIHAAEGILQCGAFAQQTFHPPSLKASRNRAFWFAGIHAPQGLEGFQPYSLELFVLSMGPPEKSIFEPLNMASPRTQFPGSFRDPTGIVRGLLKLQFLGEESSIHTNDFAGREAREIGSQI